MRTSFTNDDMMCNPAEFTKSSNSDVYFTYPAACFNVSQGYVYIALYDIGTW